MKVPSLNDLLGVATEAAELAGKRVLTYFNTDITVETKADETPVTRADREAEEIIRARITKTYPDHAIIGEENGEKRGSDPVKWIIDPIDGTKTFIRGVPLFGILIAVEVQGKASVGVVYLPALKEMVSAATGQGCFWNGRKAEVSKTKELKEASLLLSDVTHAMNRSDAYEHLAKATKLQRTWGDAYGYVLVATGRADIMIDPIMNPWDCGPFLPIMQEAGGVFSDWTGNQTIWGKDAFATNLHLHQQVLEILKSEKKR